MKSLTESILSTSGVGADALIRKWLEENDVIKGWKKKRLSNKKRSYFSIRG